MSRPRPARRRNAPLIAALAATLVVGVLYAGHKTDVTPVRGLELLELASLDARFRIRGERAPSSDEIVIVGVDDATRRDFPEIFQARRGWARLLDAIDALEPKAIALDLFFSSPEVALSPETVAAARAAYEGLVEPLEPPAAAARAALGAVVEETRGDEVLADAVARSGRVVLGAFFHVGAARPDAVEPAGLAGARYGELVDVALPADQRPFAATRASVTMPSIAAGALGAGAVNVLVDGDAGARRVPLVIGLGRRHYLPLGLAMALRAMPEGSDTAFAVGSREVTAGPHRLPVSARAVAQLDFLGADPFPRLSASEVIAGRVPDGALAGKLVFVGYTDSARDKLKTPFSNRADGVLVHATLAHNVLHDELLRPVSWTTTLIVIFLMGAAIAALQLRRIRGRRAWVAGVAALGLLLVYLVVAQLAFRRGVVLDVAAPLVAGIVIAMVSMIAALATEGREKARMRTVFSQYVSGAVVERILANPELARLGGERRELSVLFSDIRGFSRHAEKLEPEQLSALLNEYLTPMTGLVLDEGGMLDKYIGDAVMAVYGAPIEQRDHAVRACRTALAMQASMAALNRKWGARGLPDLAIGVGINTGPMAVGNMGSEVRFDYTVLGDAVNLASRLEALTRDYRVDVLCGEDTRRAIGEGFVTRELDWVRVKGRTAVGRIYELCGAAGDGAARFTDGDLAAFAAALAAYRARDWDGAETGFRDFLSRHPGDGPAAVLLERVAALRVDPPPGEWDGVYEQVSK